VFTRETSNVKREIKRKFSVPTKIGQILAVLGVSGSGGLKSCNFYSKGTCVRETRTRTRETPNVKREIKRKFSVPTKIGQILAVLGV